MVFLNNEDITGWLNSSDVNDDRDFTNIFITQTNSTQLQVTFKSGMILLNIDMETFTQFARMYNGIIACEQ